MSNSLTRRALLCGSAAAGALAGTAGTALPTLPAVAAGDPDSELLALWQRRCELTEQAYRNEYDPGNEALYDEMTRLECAIFATPAAGMTGILVKLRALIVYDHGERNMPPPTSSLDAFYEGGDRNLDDRAVRSLWADAERIIGGAA